MSEQPVSTPRIVTAVAEAAVPAISELSTVLRPKGGPSPPEPTGGIRQAWLVVLQAKRPQLGAVVRLDTSIGYRFRLGTNETCDIVLQDEQKKISREHAEIEFDAQQRLYVLRDLRSTNETFVRFPNQTAYRSVTPNEPVTLLDGTAIRLGPEGILTMLFRQTD